MLYWHIWFAKECSFGVCTGIGIFNRHAHSAELHHSLANNVNDIFRTEQVKFKHVQF
jgi:hypothetical protein